MVPNIAMIFTALLDLSWFITEDALGCLNIPKYRVFPFVLFTRTAGTTVGRVLTT